MPTYAALLGHQPHVSMAELAAVLPGVTFAKRIGPWVLFKTPEQITQEHLEGFGGTVLIARECKADGALADAPAILKTETANVKGKVTFALRGEGIASRALHDLYRTCKQVLKNANRTSRYVGNEKIPAATALLHDTGLVSGKDGCELVLLQGSDEDDPLWIGRLVAAHRPSAYADRDIGKPARDTTAGLLPPKLAQIMLNFGLWLLKKSAKRSNEQTSKSVTVLDPFCGSGVIPMECILKRWHVLASDSSQRAIDATTRNLEWLRRKKEIGKKDVASSIWKQNATKPFDMMELREEILRKGPDVIVSETTLGPALRDRPNAKDVAGFRRESEELEAEFIKNMAACFPGVPLVLTWPVWYLRTGPVFLEKPWSTIGKLGYEAALPAGLEGNTPSKKTLLYRRPDQFVGREIVLLRKK